MKSKQQDCDLFKNSPSLPIRFGSRFPGITAQALAGSGPNVRDQFPTHTQGSQENALLLNPLKIYITMAF
jgi:hypothetical protein